MKRTRLCSNDRKEMKMVPNRYDDFNTDELLNPFSLEKDRSHC